MRKLLKLGMWYTPVIPALRRRRQEDHEVKTSLDYIERSCLKEKQKRRNRKGEGMRK
jgi:hypothetical protein